MRLSKITISLCILVLSSCYGGGNRVQPARQAYQAMVPMPVYGSASDAILDRRPAIRKPRFKRGSHRSKFTDTRRPSRTKQSDYKKRIRPVSRINSEKQIGESDLRDCSAQIEPVLEFVENVQDVTDHDSQVTRSPKGYPGIKISAVHRLRRGRYVDVSPFMGTGFFTRNSRGEVELNTVKHVTDGQPPYKIPTHIEYEINGRTHRVAIDQGKLRREGPGEIVKVTLLDSSHIPESLVLEKAIASDTPQAVTAYGYPGHNGRNPVEVKSQIVSNSILENYTASNPLQPSGQSNAGTQIKVPLNQRESTKMSGGISGGPVLNASGQVIGAVSISGSDWKTDRYGRRTSSKSHYYTFSPFM